MENRNSQNVLKQDDQIASNQYTATSEDLQNLRAFLENMTKSSIEQSKVDSRMNHVAAEKKDASPLQVNFTIGPQGPALVSSVSEPVALVNLDGGWGWLVVLGAFIFTSFIDGLCYTYGLLVPEILDVYDSLDDNYALAFLPGSVITGLYIMAGPFAHILANNFDYRRVVLFGSLISAVALLIASFSSRSYSLYLAAFGFMGGLGFGLIYLPAVAIVGNWFTQRRAQALGLTLCGSGLGTALFAQTTPLGLQSFGFSHLLMIWAAVGVQITLAVVVFRPVEVHQKILQQRRKQKELQSAQHSTSTANRQRARSSANQRPRKKKRVIVQRGSIMQKIIEEKKRQRTSSMGSLDGMFLTRDNELIKSTSDKVVNPALSITTINRIVDTISKKACRLREAGVDSSRALTGSQTTSRPPIHSQMHLAKSADVLGQLAGSQSRSVSVAMIQRPNTVVELSSGVPISAQPSSGGIVAMSEIGTPSVIYVPQIAKIKKDPLQQSMSGGSASDQCDLNQQEAQPAEAAADSSTALSNQTASPPQNDAGVNWAPEISVECQPAVNAGTNFNQTRLTSSCWRHMGLFFSLTFDPNLLTSPTFMLLALGNVFSMLGYFVPIHYLPLFLLKNRRSVDFFGAGHILTLIGVGNLLGRFLASIYIEKNIGEKFRIFDCLWLHVGLLIAAAVTSLLFSVCESLIGLCVLGSLYSLFVAFFISLKSILVVELFGIDRLATSFSFLLIFQGGAVIISLPLSVCLQGELANPQLFPASPFIFTALCLLVSALLHAPLRCVADCERHRLERVYGLQSADPNAAVLDDAGLLEELAFVDGMNGAELNSGAADPQQLMAFMNLLSATTNNSSSATFFNQEPGSDFSTSEFLQQLLLHNRQFGQLSSNPQEVINEEE